MTEGKKISSSDAYTAFSAALHLTAGEVIRVEPHHTAGSGR